MLVRLGQIDQRARISTNKKHPRIFTLRKFKSCHRVLTIRTPYRNYLKIVMPQNYQKAEPFEKAREPCCEMVTFDTHRPNFLAPYLRDSIFRVWLGTALKSKNRFQVNASWLVSKAHGLIFSVTQCASFFPIYLPVPSFSQSINYDKCSILVLGYVAIGLQMTSSWSVSTLV